MLTRTDPGPTPGATAPVSPLPKVAPPGPPPRKELQGLSIEQVNHVVDAVHQNHMRLFGTKPSPGLTFDVVRGVGMGAIPDINHLFDIPKSKGEALVRQTAPRLRATDPGAGAAIVKAQGHKLTPQQQAALGVAQGHLTPIEAKQQLTEAGIVPKLQIVQDAGGWFGKIITGSLDSALKIAGTGVLFIPGTYSLGKAGIIDARDAAYLAERHAGLPVPAPASKKDIHPNRIGHFARDYVTKQIPYDFTHAENWPFALMDAWAAVSLGTGAVSRVGSAAARAGQFERASVAAQRIRIGIESDDVSKFIESAKPGALKAPKVEKVRQAVEGFRKPDVHLGFELGWGSYTEMVPAFENSALRLVQGWYLGKAQKRLIERQTEGFEGSQHSRLVDALFSTENLLHRQRVARNNIEYAIATAPLVEMSRLNNWAARTKSVVEMMHEDPSLKMSELRAREKLGIDKALELIFTDAEDPITAWRNHHQRQIADLNQQKDDFLAINKEETEALRARYDLHREAADDLQAQVKELAQKQDYSMPTTEALGYALYATPASKGIRSLARRLVTDGFGDERVVVKQRANGKMILDGDRAHELVAAAKTAGVEQIPVTVIKTGSSELKELRSAAGEQVRLANKVKPAMRKAEKVMQQTPKERARYINEFDYKIAAHNGQLSAIDLAERLLANPPKRLKAIVDRAYEISAKQEMMKEVVYGLDPEIANQHLAEIAAILRGEKLVPILDEEGNPTNRLGVVVPGPVPDEELRKAVRSATVAVRTERNKLGTLRLRKAAPTKKGNKAGAQPRLDARIIEQEAAVYQAESDLGKAIKDHETKGSTVEPLRRQITGAPELRSEPHLTRVYHGSQVLFGDFNPNQTRMTQYGRGMYLSTDARKASSYATTGIEPRGTWDPETSSFYSSPHVRMHRIDERKLFDTRSSDAGFVKGVQGRIEKVIPASVREILHDRGMSPKAREEAGLPPDDRPFHSDAYRTPSLAYDSWVGWGDSNDLITGLTIAFNTAINDGLLKAPAGMEGADLANQAFAKIGFSGYKTSSHERFIFDQKDIHPAYESVPSPALATLAEMRADRGSAYSGRLEREVFRGEGVTAEGVPKRKTRFGFKPPKDQTTALVRMDGKALEIGDSRWDTSQLLAEDLRNVVRGAFATVHYHDLWHIGVTDQISDYHMPIRDIQSVPSNLRKVVRALERNVIEPDAAVILSEENLQALRNYLYPDRTTIETSDPHIRWVDERLAMSRFAGENLDFWRNLDQAASGTFQWVNRPWRLLVIFGSPAYLLNAGGAAVTLAVEHGFASPELFGRSIMAKHMWSPEVQRLLDQLAGSTHAVSLLTESEGKFSMAERGFVQFWQKYTDRAFRRAAVIGELYKRGVIHDGMSPDEVLERLQSGIHPMLNKLGAKEGVDVATGKLVIEASRVARKQMLDFDKMSWPERAVLRHIFFVYAFLRAGTIWSLRFMGEHPVQWDITSHAGQERRDQIKQLIGKTPEWFYQSGYFSPFDNNTVFNSVQFDMPGVASQVLYPAQSLWKDAPYSNVSDMFGAAGIGLTGLATGRTPNDQPLPGHSGRLVGSLLEIAEQTPFGYAAKREQKLQKQKEAKLPAPPVVVSENLPGEGAAKRERAFLNLSPFELDGFWNQWGRTISRTGSSQQINEMAMHARYWRDLRKNDPVAYVQHEVDLIQGVMERQAEVLGEPVPDDVQEGLNIVGHREVFIEEWKNSPKGNPQPGDRQLAVLTIAFLKKSGIITDAKANEYKKLLSQAHGTSAWRGVWLKALHENGTKAWADWRKKVNDVNYFNTDRFTSVIQNLNDQELGDYSKAASASNETKWAYGRKYVDYIQQRGELADQIRAATNGADKQLLREKLRTLDNAASEEVKIKGTSFPAMAAVKYGKLDLQHRQQYLRSKSLSEWAALDTYDRQLLTGEKPDPAIAQGYGILAQWMQEKTDALKPGEHLPGNTRTYYAQILAGRATKSGNTSFRDDLIRSGILPKKDGTRTLLAERLQSTSPILGSPYRAQWDYMLGYVSYAFKKSVSDGWTTNSDKPNYSGISEVWSSYYLPRVKSWLDTQPQGFRREVEAYEAEHNQFLKSLVRP